MRESGAPQNLAGGAELPLERINDLLSRLLGRVEALPGELVSLDQFAAEGLLGECWPHHCAPQYPIRRVTFRRWTGGPFGR